MNNELEMTRKEGAVAKFEVMSKHLSGKTEEYHDEPVMVLGVRSPPQYKSEAVTLEATSSAKYVVLPSESESFSICRTIFGGRYSQRAYLV
jgi:hypothetical protein